MDLKIIKILESPELSNDLFANIETTDVRSRILKKSLGSYFHGKLKSNLARLEHHTGHDTINWNDLYDIHPQLEDLYVGILNELHAWSGEPQYNVTRLFWCHGDHLMTYIPSLGEVAIESFFRRIIQNLCHGLVDE